MTAPVRPAVDLLGLTAELVDVASPSRSEADLVVTLEARLREADHLEVSRVGDNLVARTSLGRRWRLVLGGHTDTVPANGNLPGRLDGDRLYGLGAADMKGGLAVMLDLALRVPEPAVDCTYVFYAREEVASVESGLGELFERRPDLLRGRCRPAGRAHAEERSRRDARAPCAWSSPWPARGPTPPVPGWVATPCIGSPASWARSTATRSAGPSWTAVSSAKRCWPCRWRGAWPATWFPTRCASCSTTASPPIAPPAEAEAHVHDVVDPWLEPGDTVEVVECADGAAPSHTHPLIATLVARQGLEVRAKLGWTDVARFAEHGVPAANFGPGEATVAHTQGEYLDRSELESAWRATHDLLVSGPDAE